MSNHLTTTAVLLSLAAALSSGCDCDTSRPFAGDANSEAARAAFASVFVDDTASEWRILETGVLGEPGCDWGMSTCIGTAIASHPDADGDSTWAVFKLETGGADDVTVWVETDEGTGWELLASS